MRRVDEVEHLRKVRKEPIQRCLRDTAPRRRGMILSRNLGAVLLRVADLTTERLVPLSRGVARDELAQLVDDRHGRKVAFALRVAPREQPVSAEHDAVAAGRILDNLAQHHAQLEARPLPRQPRQLVAELRVELLHLLLAVRRRGQSDAPIRVQVVDVRKGQKAVQRRIDRRRDGVAAERGERVHLHHFIFELDALVRLLEREQLVHVERREARALNRSQVSTRALDPEHLRRLARKRVHHVDLGAGVAGRRSWSGAGHSPAGWSGSGAAPAHPVSRPRPHPNDPQETSVPPLPILIPNELLQNQTRPS